MDNCVLKDLYIYLVLFAVLSSLVASDFQCKSNYHPKFDLLSVKNGDHDIQTRSTSFDQPFRLFVHYDSSIYNQSLQVRNTIKDSINELKNFLESALMVRRTASSILYARDCINYTSPVIIDGVNTCVHKCSPVTTCGPIVIPTEHLMHCTECNGDTSACETTGADGVGVSDADYVAYVSASHELCIPGSTVAYAGPCKLESDFDRPIIGIINYCPDEIANTTGFDIFDVTKHEFMHALGFGGLYAWFRDENGNPRAPRDSNGFPLSLPPSIVKMVNYNNWQARSGSFTKTVTLLTTPKVVEEGRRHFNCSTLEGVELEDQGGAGTGSSHWEKRILESEGMIGSVHGNPKFSRFTFALLEDSGWYKVNYSFADQLVWGRGDGCGYVTGSCGGYIKSQKLKRESIAPFCDYLTRPEDTTKSSYGCTIDRSAVSFCNLEERVNITIPAIYQYFDSGENFNSSTAMLESIGGHILSNFCPYQQGTLYCSDINNMKSGIYNSAAQEYGPNSRCIEHDGVWTASSDAMGSFTPSFVRTAGCYEYFCSDSQVNIIVLNQTYTCSSPGQVINVNETADNVTYTGTLVCPSCVQICYDDFDNCPEAAVLYNNSVVLSSSASSYGFSNLLVMVQLMMITVLILLYL